MIRLGHFNPVGFDGWVRQKLAAQDLHKVFVLARCTQQGWVVIQPFQNRVGGMQGKPFATRFNIGLQARLLGGPSVFNPSLIKARISGNIDEITAGKIESGSRIISGSVLYGHASEGVMNYLGFYDSLISAIPDEANDIFLNWLMPGSNLHSKLNVFISSLLKPSKFIFNTSVNGGDRAIVPVGSYDEVLPMDILVPQLLKALVVGDREQAVDLGPSTHNSEEECCTTQ